MISCDTDAVLGSIEPHHIRAQAAQRLTEDACPAADVQDGEPPHRPVDACLAGRADEAAEEGHAHSVEAVEAFHWALGIPPRGRQLCEPLDLSVVHRRSGVPDGQQARDGARTSATSGLQHVPEVWSLTIFGSSERTARQRAPYIPQAYRQQGVGHYERVLAGRGASHALPRRFRFRKSTG